MLSPKEYGASLGGFRRIEPQNIVLHLSKGGINTSADPELLEEGESSQALDVRFLPKGLASDYALQNFGSAYGGLDDPNIIHLAAHETEAAQKYIMRIRPAGWDRWNGVNWFTLPGTVSGSLNDKIYAVTAKNKFIVANGVDKLKMWDGDDTHAVADLSADAPIASYITRIGTRLFVARIKIGVDVHPNTVAWSADDDHTEWTDPLQGAGSAELNPEGSRAANFITGLSTLERGVLIYRQRSIMLGQLTGIGSQPFRFTTLDFTHGTESPYSIISGGMKSGDFYFGHDYMPYNFDGQSESVPIGFPIYDELKDTVADLSLVIGGLDSNEQEYWIAFPTETGSTTLEHAWVFSIRTWRETGRLVWRKRTLPAGCKVFGYSQLALVTDPIVDTLTDLVNNYANRVDDWGRATGPERIIFGDDIGQVKIINKAASIEGSWMSKQLAAEDEAEITVDKIRLRYMATSGATVGVSISTDDGLSFGAEVVHTLTPSSPGSGYSVSTHRVTGRGFRIRLRPLTGFCVINQVKMYTQNLGRTNG